MLHIVWQRTKGFLHRASTLILACAVVIWFLLAIPAYPGAGTFSDVEIGDSLFGAVSKIIAPVFAPAGFDHWEATGALITGMVAKEVIVGTLNQVYLDGSAADAPEEAAPTLGEEVGGIITAFGEAVALTAQEAVNIVPRTVNLVPGVALPEARFVETAGEDEGGTALEAALTTRFTPLAAVAFNVFVLLYVPCMATISVMRMEFGRRWTWHLIAYNAVVAWVVAVAVFQIGTLLGLG
ncbi:MAG: hypothetical protein M5R40_02030 [Anaerolineae bacterium]|nr:hypothetical protein [Anaerolineae bacterium]